MPRSLSPIPAGVAITDGQGIITMFFRLAWQILVDGFSLSPTVATLDLVAQTAAVATTTLFLTKATGVHRVNWALTRTVDDGVSSSLQITIGWVQNAVPRTELETALTEASGLSFQGVARPIYADENTNITMAVAYASNTPNRAKFDLHANAEAMI